MSTTRGAAKVGLKKPPRVPGGNVSGGWVGQPQHANPPQAPAAGCRTSDLGLGLQPSPLILFAARAPPPGVRACILIAPWPLGAPPPVSCGMPPNTLLPCAT